MSVLKTSPRGIFGLVLHEGIVPGPYRDSVGVWTWGVGHTAAAGSPPEPAAMPRGVPSDLDSTLREVFRVFRIDLAKYEEDVRAALKVSVKQHEFDALVSFHYNTGAIARATLVKDLNAGRRDAAASGFMSWKKPPEIIPRRQAEQRLFRDGVYPSGRASVWSVTAAGRVIWTPLRKMGEVEVIQALQ